MVSYATMHLDTTTARAEVSDPLDGRVPERYCAEVFGETQEYDDTRHEELIDRIGGVGAGAPWSMRVIKDERTLETEVWLENLAAHRRVVLTLPRLAEVSLWRRSA